MERVALVGAKLRGDINRVAPLIALAARRGAKASGQAIGKARAAAIWRSGGDDLVRVDGFDAAFAGWGREDSDIIIRLIRSRGAPQGRPFRDRRAAPVASGERPHPAAGQREAARGGASHRPHSRRARAVGAEPERRLVASPPACMRIMRESSDRARRCSIASAGRGLPTRWRWPSSCRCRGRRRRPAF